MYFIPNFRKKNCFSQNPINVKCVACISKFILGTFAIWRTFGLPMSARGVPRNVLSSRKYVNHVPKHSHTHTHTHTQLNRNRLQRSFVMFIKSNYNDSLHCFVCTFQSKNEVVRAWFRSNQVAKHVWNVFLPAQFLLTHKTR